MIPLRFFPVISSFAAVALLASCANRKPVVTYTKDGKVVNPYPAGSYDHFKTESSYPKTYSVWKNDALLAQTNSENSSIFISLAKQRGFLMNGNDVVLDYPICSGIPSRPTPVGTFYVLEKVVEKRSNKYGRIYDVAGELVNGDADTSMDTVPEGGRFEGASMRYWMRLTHDGVGHHIGPVKRRPASHACIRGPSETMPLVYSKVKEGTRIIIQ
ncbi:MAG: L,D-transpeptidase [Akkermansiaceae bacterium]|nr:L,D-transpeptidase [Akkermansiaceae bacterium]